MYIYMYIYIYINLCDVYVIMARVYSLHGLCVTISIRVHVHINSCMHALFKSVIDHFHAVNNFGLQN